MKVNLFYRKKRKYAYSIEELFKSISKKLTNYNSIKIELPYSKASMKEIYLNCLFCIKYFNKLNHVTGDVHYIVPFLGSKTILTIHDVKSILQGNFISYSIKKLFWFWLPILFAKKITVISNFTKKEVLKIAPWAKKKITIIPNPINFRYLSQIKKQQNVKFTVLIIGTKTNKNLTRIFNSLKSLDLKLNIIGNLSKEQKTLAKDLKLNYTNYQNLNYKEVLEIYSKSDLLCFPSIYEGFGMPILEAQAIGIPVLTSNLSPMKDIAGESALLVNPYSIKNIRECIIRIIESPILQEELIIKGKENVLRYDIHAIAKQYENLYKEIENV
ncbi:glycosyltransferase [Flammeovirga agarivorans]|uniref:Glycosyltransferase family 4 protein n=1 Tax=Flammeovirga agarivorans TaxID=2726742 RepID=A0A7X8XUR1_9BACT|nr:glycosyltransferase [Flammeovirga agarivorans]NLR90499.1 glycosyltransferase family 4 protein [Flammeovirga agarivorans]